MTTPSPAPCRNCCSATCAGPGLTFNAVTGQYEVLPAPGGGITVGPTGVSATPAAPTVVTAGPGADVAPIPGGFQVSAAPSVDAGNLLTLGADGNNFINCAAVAACVPDTVVTAGPGADITGNGDPGTPYQVSVLPSTEAGNLISAGPDGRLSLTCTDIAACGGGTVVTAGPGADVTPIPGGFQVSAAPSTDAGNVITLGTDGNVLLTCAGIAACGGGTVVTAGPGVDVAPIPGGFQVSAAPSTDLGNTLTLGTDGNMLLTCPTIAACIDVIANPLTPELAVTGNGPVGDPFVISEVALVHPRARVRTDADFVLADEVPGGTVIPYQIETYDRGNLWDPGAPTRLTVPAGWDGVYSLGANAQFRQPDPPDVEGFRAAFIRLNGGAILAFQQQRNVYSLADSTILNISTDMELVAGDFIELFLQSVMEPVGQTPVIVAAGAEWTVAFWLTFLHR